MRPKTDAQWRSLYAHLAHVAREAVAHVGAANYSERQDEANGWIHDAEALMDMDTWTCHICGEERPDAKIGVHSIDTSEEWGLEKGTMTMNVRYCLDKPECIEGSRTYRFAINLNPKEGTDAQKDSA